MENSLFIIFLGANALQFRTIFDFITFILASVLIYEKVPFLPANTKSVRYTFILGNICLIVLLSIGVLVYDVIRLHKLLETLKKQK